MKRPTQADVARMAGVSRATVSYVLNDRLDGRIRITPETRRKVLQAAEELGYAPNALAVSLRSGASRMIGFLMPWLHNPHYWDILQGAEDEIAERGYHLVLETANLDPKRERRAIQSLFQGRLDGLILIPTFIERFSEEIQLLAERRSAVVLLKPNEDTDWVFPDIRDGYEVLMDHLLSLGHRRIAFVNGVLRRRIYQLREVVYREKMAEAGLTVDPALLCYCGPRAQDAYLETRALLDLDDPPSAISTVNDLLAIGALRAIHERGLRVPDDVALAGFDDSVFAEQLYPPLTTVRMPARELGRRAVELLFARLENPKCDLMQELIPMGLVIRQSTVGALDAADVPEHLSELAGAN